MYKVTLLLCCLGSIVYRVHAGCVEDINILKADEARLQQEISDQESKINRNLNRVSALATGPNYCNCVSITISGRYYVIPERKYLREIGIDGGSVKACGICD